MLLMGYEFSYELSLVYEGVLLTKISQPHQILLQHRLIFTCICYTV